MLRATPHGEDGVAELERFAERRALPATAHGGEGGERERAPDYLHLVGVAESQAGAYVQQINRKSWSHAYRAFHNQHFLGSKYGHKDFARRSKIFVPKTRSAMRKDAAAVAASLFGTVDAIACSPGNEADPRQRAAAALIQELINYRTDRTSGRNAIPWFLVALGARQDAMLTGVCASKQYWRLELRSAGAEPVTQHNPVSGRDEPVFELDPDTGADAPQMREVFVPDIDRPDITLFPPECVIIDPAADWTNPAQSAAYLILKYPMRLDDIERRQSDPRDPWKPIDRGVLQSASETAKLDASAIRRAREFGLDRLDETQNTEEFRVIWVYESFIRHAGEDVCFFSVGDKAYLTDPRPVREVYPEQAGDRPIVIGYGSLESHRLYPMSPVESWQPTQQEINDVRNLFLDTMKQNVAPVTKVVRGRNVDLDALHRRGPNSHILMSRLDDVEFAQAPDVPPSVVLGLEHLNIDLDDLAGQFNSGSVQTNRTLNDTVGGLRLIAGAANSVQEFDIRLWIETWAEPVLAQVVRLEQFYESNTIILGLAGERAQLMQKFGIDRLDDDLLEAQVTIRINAGLGVGDPNQRLQKFQGAAAVAGPLVAQSREFQSGEMSVDVEGILDEVFGAVGYRDGGKRFFKKNPPSPPLPPAPQAVLALQKLVADIEKSKAQAAHAQLTGLAAVQRAQAASGRIANGAIASGRITNSEIANRGLGASSPPIATARGGEVVNRAPPNGAPAAHASPLVTPPIPGVANGPAAGGDDAIRHSPFATRRSTAPQQVTPETLAQLMQLLQGQLPAQRQVELLREEGKIAGARVTEPDGRVRHFGFDRGADGRIAGARPMIPPGLRQAPDGNHYLPDPARPGKYLMLKH